MVKVQEKPGGWGGGWEASSSGSGRAPRIQSEAPASNVLVLMFII